VKIFRSVAAERRGLIKGNGSNLTPLGSAIISVGAGIRSQAIRKAGSLPQLGFKRAFTFIPVQPVLPAKDG